MAISVTVLMEGGRKRAQLPMLYAGIVSLKEDTTQGMTYLEPQRQRRYDDRYRSRSRDAR